jgi:hypothetical protein
MQKAELGRVGRSGHTGTYTEPHEKSKYSFVSSASTRAPRGIDAAPRELEHMAARPRYGAAIADAGGPTGGAMRVHPGSF